MLLGRATRGVVGGQNSGPTSDSNIGEWADAPSNSNREPSMRTRARRLWDFVRVVAGRERYPIRCAKSTMSLRIATAVLVGSATACAIMTDPTHSDERNSKSPYASIDLATRALQLPEDCTACVLLPTTFARPQGTNRSFRLEFRSDTVTDHMLVVHDDGQPTTGVEINLNGRTIVGERDLIGADVTEAHANVALVPVNDLTIRVGGNKGATITIWIVKGAKTIDNSGGTILAPGGSVLHVPPGAFASPAALFVEEVSVGTSPSPFGSDAPGFEDVVRQPTEISIRYQADAPASEAMQLDFPSGSTGDPFVLALSAGGENSLRYLPNSNVATSPGAVSTPLAPTTFWSSSPKQATLRMYESRALLGASAARTSPHINRSATGATSVLPGCVSPSAFAPLLSPLPSPGQVDPTGYFGAARPGSRSGFHAGADLEDGTGGEGAAVYAAESGSASWTWYNPFYFNNGKLRPVPGNYGYAITVKHADGTRSFYGHLQPDAFDPASGPIGPLSSTSPGATVQISKGQLLGYVGISGRVNITPADEPPHVHFEYSDRLVPSSAASPLGPVINPIPCREFISSWTFNPNPVAFRLVSGSPSSQSVIATAQGTSGSPITGLFLVWSTVDENVAVVDKSFHGGTNTVSLASGISSSAATRLEVLSGGTIGSEDVTVSASSLGSVLLDPYGFQTVPGPYHAIFVDGSLNPSPAPQDVTITLLREVISACSGLLFSSPRIITIANGSSNTSYDFTAGRDPKCSNLPIRTQYTVQSAVLGSGTVLDLSIVPPAQLLLNTFR